MLECVGGGASVDVPDWRATSRPGVGDGDRLELESGLRVGGATDGGGGMRVESGMFAPDGAGADPAKEVDVGDAVAPFARTMDVADARGSGERESKGTSPFGTAASIFGVDAADGPLCAPDIAVSKSACLVEEVDCAGELPARMEVAGDARLDVANSFRLVLGG